MAMLWSMLCLVLYAGIILGSTVFICRRVAVWRDLLITLSAFCLGVLGQINCWNDGPYATVLFYMSERAVAVFVPIASVSEAILYGFLRTIVVAVSGIIGNSLMLAAIMLGCYQSVFSGTGMHTAVSEKKANVEPVD